MRNADISKILGEEWRKMPEKDKQPYVQQAVYLRRQHKIDYPNYRYRPRRKNSPAGERFDRAAPYSRMFSNVFLPVPSSSAGGLRGSCVPYNYDSYLPAPRFPMDRLELPAPGITFQPKVIAPYNSSYLLPHNELTVKDYTSFPCDSQTLSSPSSLRDGIKMTSPSCPSGTSTYSTLPYVVLPAKNQF